MATKAADPYDLDYAENTSGTFGSGWVPGVKTGGFPAAAAPNGAGNKTPAIASSPNDPVGAPAVAGGKVLYPQGGRNLSGPAGNMVSLKETPEQTQARILGTSKLSPGQTVQQMQAQNDFDKRMGFKPSHSDEDIKRISDMVNPANPANNNAAPTLQTSPSNQGTSPSAGAQSPTGPLNALNPPTIGQDISPQTGNALLGVPTGQEVPPGAAVQAGQATRAAVESARNPVAGFESFKPSFAPEKPIVDAPALLGSGWRGAKRAVANVAGNVASTVRGFASGFASGGGDRVASGVSNASASQFEKPTKANPVPVTPTTPVADVDKSQESLGRFGYSDDEFNKRKLAFSGF